MRTISCVPQMDGRTPSRIGAHDVCVFIDLFFATTTILTALAAGIDRVRLASDFESFASRLRSGEAALFATEAHLIETHFPGPEPAGRRNIVKSTPCNVRDHIGPARELVLWSSRGTPGLLALRGTETLFVGAEVNRSALVERLFQQGFAERDIVIVCAGGLRGPAIEDVWCAGRFIEACMLRSGSAAASIRLDSSAEAARALSRRLGEVQLVQAAPVAQLALQRGDRPELAFSLTQDTCPVVARLFDDGVIRAVSPAP